MYQKPHLLLMNAGLAGGRESVPLGSPQRKAIYGTLVSCPLHSTPYTLHFTPYTLHPTP